jgi:WD40 repeat protein
MLFTTHKDHKILVWNFTVSDSFRFNKVSTLPRRGSFLLYLKRTNTHKHKDCISCIAYYHAQGLLYTGSYDKMVKAWRISDKKRVDSFVAHADNVNAILVSQDDGCVFTCSSDESVKIWRRVYRENSPFLPSRGFLFYSAFGCKNRVEQRSVGSISYSVIALFFLQQVKGLKDSDPPPSPRPYYKIDLLAHFCHWSLAHFAFSLSLYVCVCLCLCGCC